jgi:secondary thiamine-phosphate synthase enzyme
VLIGVPRVSPERELAAIRALIKPQEGAALRHRIDSGEQALPPGGADRVRQVAAAAATHLGLGLDVHLPPAGEYLALAQCPFEALPTGLAVALMLSHELPGLWVVAGRLYVRDGAFFRRERGVKLNLRPAANVHLSKPVRAAYRRALAELTDPSAPPTLRHLPTPRRWRNRNRRVRTARMTAHPPQTITVPTRSRSQMVDVTRRVAERCAAAGVRSGFVIVYCPHTTAGVTIQENADPDVQHDLLAKLDALVPRREAYYRHAEGNSDSHLKTAMVGNSATGARSRTAGSCSGGGRGSTCASSTARGGGR